MALYVQKFGGTSVGTPDRIREVADHVARCRKRGDDVVLVVSAMGKETDELLRRTNERAAASVQAPSDETDSSTQFGPERLLHDESGMEFAIVLNGDTMVGRKDPVTGIYPEVDLTPVDTQRSISRRHAKLFRRDDKLYLCEEIGTMNGTFVNGERLATGVAS